MIATSTASAATTPLAARATTTATKPLTSAPTIGTKAPKKTSTPSGTASGTPITATDEPDEDGVGEGDEDRAAHVGGQDRPDRTPAALMSGWLRRGNSEHAPAPDALAVEQEEDGGEERDGRPGEHLERDRRTRQRAGQQAVAVVLQGLPRLLEVVLQLQVVDVEVVAQPQPDLPQAVGERAAEVLERPADLDGQQRHDTSEPGHRDDEDDRGRHAARAADPALHDPHDRREQRTDEQRRRTPTGRPA